jgi:hypothetical protein
MSIYDELNSTTQRAMQWNGAEPPRPEQLLKIANYYCAARDGRAYKLRQITQYNWIEQCHLDTSCARLMMRLPRNVSLEHGYQATICGRDIVGFIDVMINRTKGEDGQDNVESIYELKCAGELRDEHALQLTLYALMHSIATETNFDCYLYNVMTDELKRVEVALEDMIWIAKTLIHYRYHNRCTISDETFIAMTRGEDIDFEAACTLCNDTPIVCRHIHLDDLVKRK